VDTI
jgi:serine/threonine protein kinase